MGAYLCEAISIEGFVQQLALAYVQHGYLFYVVGSIPEGKELRRVDDKLIQVYGVNASRWTRYRRAKAGLANVHYLRFRRFFVIIASKGQHLFWEREKQQIKDIRVSPIRFAGYSISYRRARGGSTWHPSIRIEGTIEYPVLKARFLSLAPHLAVEDMSRAFLTLPFEPYAPVRQQLIDLLRLVNKKRKAASLELVPFSAIRLTRRSVRPFGDDLAEPDPPECEIADRPSCKESPVVMGS